MKKAWFVALAAASLVPAAAACGSSDDAKDATVQKAKITAKGCEPAPLTLKAGTYKFDITNEGGKGDEFEILDGKKILAEKEGIVDGLSGSFTITLKAGSYTLYCPGGSNEKKPLTVTD